MSNTKDNAVAGITELEKDEATKGKGGRDVGSMIDSIRITAPKSQFFLQVTHELTRLVEKQPGGLVARKLSTRRPFSWHTGLNVI